MEIKYPQVKVRWIAGDNAFAILAACQLAAKRAGLTPEQIDEWHNEATSGDYDHLLEVCEKYFIHED
jgi:hypothetical protein